MIKGKYKNKRHYYEKNKIHHYYKSVVPSAIKIFIPKKDRQPGSQKWTKIISKSEFVLILTTFFKIYFKNFHKTREDQYFFLGGMLAKIKGQRVILSKQINCINWLWYQRPPKYFKAIKLVKIKGGNSFLFNLEQESYHFLDRATFPNTTEKINTLIDNNKFHLPCKAG